MSDLAKVGAVVIIVLVLFFGIAQLVKGNVMFRGRTYFVVVRFKDGTGLRPGMPLKMGGKDIGFVEQISLSDPIPMSALPPEQAALVLADAKINGTQDQGDIQYTEAKIRIQKEVKRVGKSNVKVYIYQDAQFVISQEGLIGEKYLSVNPGSSLKPVVDESDKGNYIFYGRTEDFISASLHKVTQSLTSGLFGEGGSLGGSMNDFTGKLNASLDGINTLVTNANGLIIGNQGSITASLRNVKLMSVNFLALSQNLEDASLSIVDLAKDPKYTDALKGVTDDLTAVSSSLNHLTSQLDSLVSDPQVQQDAKDSVRLTKETLEEAKKTLERFQKTMDKADGVLDGASGVMDDASGAIKDVKGKVDQLSSIGSTVDVKMGMQVRAVDKNRDHNLSSDDSYVGDLNMAVGYQDTYLSLGADNIGQDNNWNFMLGWGDLNGFSVRGGVYHGELGLGAMYNTPSGGGVDVMLYDTADPKLNAYGRIPVGDSVNVVLGVEDVENDPQATVGIGVKLK